MSRFALLLLFGLPVFPQDTKQGDCPMHDQRSVHQAVVESHGDQAMGFPHDKTTHHFRLSSDGGAVEAIVNDPSDTANSMAIRSHLLHITMMFSNGDFSTPMFIHDGIPPGVKTMKLMKTTIHYNYEEILSGGRLRIQSTDAVAVAAIHDFLRFQITEHQTRDSVETEK